MGSHPILILALCLASAAASAESQDIRMRGLRYLFAIPKILASGQNETACLSLYETAVPAKVMVDLKIKHKHHITTHTVHSEHECFHIAIPKLRPNVKEAQFVSVYLQVQLNGTLHAGHTQDPLLVYPNTDLMFIETDKSVYKPTDEVKMRILVLNQDFKAPEHHVIPMVRIISPPGITVMAWENVTTELGLSQLEYQLSQDTLRGKWKIEVNDKAKLFEVKEYISQRFSIVLNIPKFIYVSANTTKFSICGKYVYGQAVKGLALIKISFSKHKEKPINNARELQGGCAVFEFTSEALHLQEQVNSDIDITASITEHFTSRSETEAGKSYVTSQAYSLKFLTYNKHFQPGLPYYGKLKAADVLIPLQDEVVQICHNVAVDKIWNIKEINQCSNFSFGHDNTINFYLLPVKDTVLQIRLYAKSLNHSVPTLTDAVHYNTSSRSVDAYFTLNRWYSPTNSYVQIVQTNKVNLKCRTPQQFLIYYTTTKVKEQNITFSYLIKSRSKIYKIRSISHTPRKHKLFHHSELTNIVGTNHSYTKTESWVDKFVLKFKLDPRIVAKYQLMVYYVLPNGEVVAASLDVNIEKCLLNKVETNWSSPEYYPGERATLTIKTAESSLCAITAIDKSLTFGNSEHLDVNSLVKPFLVEKTAKVSNRLNCLPHAQKHTATTTQSPMWDLRRRRKRHYGITASQQFDAYEAFNNFGVAVITNIKIITKPCIREEAFMVPHQHGNFQQSNATEVQFLTNSNKDIYYYDVEDESKETSVRSFFPDTWLWELVPISKPETSISRNLPHTITNWVTNALCVSANFGVGVADQAEMSAFQPFFLEVIAPFSIKRGETLHMEVMLFNYLNYTIPVKITLGESEGMEIPGHPDERSVVHCVFSQDSKAVTFRLQGAKLGKQRVSVLAEVESSYPGECGPEVLINRRDMVVKDIIVEPEGHPIDDVKSVLLCTNDTAKTNNVSWSLELPDDVIVDSSRAKVIINADLMGPTIHNLEKLLVMPIGCGEQIMATLAPNLYVIKYLKATRKLTPPLLNRAKRNLKIGYQRILDYAHEDGSFSAFGFYDRSGSMFLTAFVVRILQQAKNYIYVDQNVIDRAVKWIVEHQLENGCFATVSHVFHDMGGTSTENSTAALTSYVIISLLESGIELKETVQTNAKYCIRGHFSPDKYTLAISTYALSLVGWESEANRSLQRLLQVATRDDSFLWWSTPGSVSTNIELTSYVLMSLLHHNTSENMVYANAVVRWLISQRGPNGGFVSTQDTAVALNAITKYAIMVGSKESSWKINITGENKEYQLAIGAEDQLKTVEQVITDLPDDISVVVEGEGCILIQANMHYNLQHLASSEAFKLAIAVDPVSTTDQCSIAIVTSCISYAGPGLHSNMAILEVTMPSGYKADRASLFALVQDNNFKVKKFEENENQVVLYFTELNNEPVCVPFSINEYSKVDELVDAKVKLYDYYHPELQVTTTYTVNKCPMNETISSSPMLK